MVTMPALPLPEARPEGGVSIHGDMQTNVPALLRDLNERDRRKVDRTQIDSAEVRPNERGGVQIGFTQIGSSEAALQEGGMFEISSTQICLRQTALKKGRMLKVSRAQVGSHQTTAPKKGVAEIRVGKIVPLKDRSTEKGVFEVNAVLRRLFFPPGIPGWRSASQEFKMVLIRHRTAFFLSHVFSPKTRSRFVLSI
jgi:hypothetical protein